MDLLLIDAPAEQEKQKKAVTVTVTALKICNQAAG